MNDPVLPMTNAETDPQRLTRFVEAFFDALEKGEPVGPGSLLATSFPELQTSPTIPNQQDLDDSHHELD